MTCFFSLVSAFIIWSTHTPGAGSAFPVLLSVETVQQQSTVLASCLKVVRIPIGAVHQDGNELTIPAPAKYRATPGYGPYVLDDVSNDEFSVHIFCSESKRWTEHIVKWYPFLLNRYIFHAPIISHNGMLYWFNGRSIVCLNPFGLVVDDDGYLRLTRTIDLPPGEGNFPVGTSRCELLGFGVTGGHLRLIIDHRVTERALKIWELDESEAGGAGRVWRLVHLVQVSKFFDRNLWTQGFGFLSFQPYDGDIFFLHILRLHLSNQPAYWKIEECRTSYSTYRSWSDRLFHHRNLTTPPPVVPNPSRLLAASYI